MTSTYRGSGPGRAKGRKGQKKQFRVALRSQASRGEASGGAFFALAAATLAAVKVKASGDGYESGTRKEV